MRKLDWKNALLYGIFTAVALALVIAFAQFLAERTGAISLTLLIAGAIGGGAVLVYLIMRWFLSEWLSRRVLDRVSQAVDRITGKFDSDSDNPVRWRDIQGTVQDAKLFATDLWGYGRSVLAVLAFMAVTVELLALANAAVMYLQAKRLQEQNELLDIQNRSHLAGFLNDSLSNVQIANDLVNDARNTIGLVSEDLISPFGILDEFVTRWSDGEVEMVHFEPVVCPSESDLCDSISVDALTKMIESGPIRVTEENVESVRAYARLSKAAEMSILPFTIEFESEESLNARINAFGDAISSAAATCGTGELLSRTSNLWTGISGVGLGSTQMFTAAGIDSTMEIVPGVEIPLSHADVLAFASATGVITQSLGEGDTLPAGPKAAAMLFARGVRSLKGDLESLVVTCETYQIDLERTIAFLSSERTRILGDIAARTQTEIADAEPDAVETEHR